ncbi:hypothetical protein B0H16DRAFT_1611492 [Mycena metata]|uniref:Uncharacterized protein n=1 Tax=Mycena metata TaxID=1033252 RepID=A0AAD7HCV0_9AGAR|nr:hypothetical protein B0H16DRAFT_1611492 [Mycena metata]
MIDRIALLVPCLRATFDALACIAFLVEFNRIQKSVMHSNLISELCREETQELIIIFAIMAMEAVFVQMPSVRAHARNYIAPFVDSLTALLATRFTMGAVARRARADAQDSSDESSHASARPSLAPPHPVSPVHGEDGPQSLPAPVLFTLFPDWPPQTLELQDDSSSSLGSDSTAISSTWSLEDGPRDFAVARRAVPCHRGGCVGVSRREAGVS